jgi:beta-phosphoglucomutase-like phosphatase (HAD superfamily)
MRIKALIFDVDGTLADTEEAHRRAFNLAFEELGLAAAKGAGLHTIVTPSQWTQGEDFSAADLVLPSLADCELGEA